MKNKSEILQDSCDYFYQNGFNGTSVDALAQYAKITKKTLYRYFDSKEQLIEDSLDFRHEWFMTQLSYSLENITGEAVNHTDCLFLVNGLVSVVHTWHQPNPAYSH